MNQTPAGDPVDYEQFRSVTFYGVLGALCPLVPVPFLDDWLLARVRRRMVDELTSRQGLTLSDEEKATLAGADEGRRFPGCFATLAWVSRKVVLKLIKKIFRKVVYVLAIREGIQTGTEVVHEGYLLLQGVERRGDSQTLQAVRVRQAIRATLDRLDLRPVRQTLKSLFHGSMGVLMKGATVLSQRFGGGKPKDDADGLSDETVREEEEVLGGLVDRAASSLWGDREHFAQARAIFLEELGSDPGRSNSTA